MKSYLYQDLYLQEEKHWWHIAKREIVLLLINKYLDTGRKMLAILDVGCGTGKNIEALGKFGKVWGLDPAPEALNFCQKRELTNLKLGYAENTPFTPRRFDLITLLDVLEHTDDYKTLKEMGRILKPKGLLIITVPAFQQLWSGWDKVLKHKRRYSKTGLTQVLTANGFRVLTISYAFSFLVIPAIVIRFIKSFFPTKEYGSDFSLNLPLVNTICGYLATIERGLIISQTIPFGLSVVAVATKE